LSKFLVVEAGDADGGHGESSSKEKKNGVFFLQWRKVNSR
jgi:hypothetical protein